MVNFFATDCDQPTIPAKAIMVYFCFPKEKNTKVQNMSFDYKQKLSQFVCMAHPATICVQCSQSMNQLLWIQWIYLGMTSRLWRQIGITCIFLPLGMLCLWPLCIQIFCRESGILHLSTEEKIWRVCSKLFWEHKVHARQSSCQRFMHCVYLV